MSERRQHVCLRRASLGTSVDLRYCAAGAHIREAAASEGVQRRVNILQPCVDFVRLYETRSYSMKWRFILNTSNRNNVIAWSSWTNPADTITSISRLYSPRENRLSLLIMSIGHCFRWWLILFIVRRTLVSMNRSHGLNVQSVRICVNDLNDGSARKRSFCFGHPR